MKFRSYHSFLVFGLGAALAGCGGGGNSGPAAAATTPAPPSLPAPPPNIPQDPAATGFDGSYAGFFAGVDQAGNVVTTNANSSALSGLFTINLAAANSGTNGTVITSGSIADDGTIVASGTGNTALPGTVSVTGQVQPLGTGLVFMGQVTGRNTQNSQNVATNTFAGRIVGIQDGTDNAYVGGYTGTLSGAGGNGTLSFTVAGDGSIRGDVNSLSTLSTIFDGFSAPRVIGAITRDGIVRLTGVSGKTGTNGGAGSSLFIDFQGQGDLANNQAVITGFYTAGAPEDGQTGTFVARRN